MNRDPSGYDITKDPIYLLQYRDYNLTSCPGWLGYDGDSYWIEPKNILGVDTSQWKFYSKGEIDVKLLFEYLCCYHEDDAIAAVETWITLSVYLTRQEAEHWGKQAEYNYPFGWRVYCIPCGGTLARILNDLPEEHQES
jgi:hypothetical protein